MDSCELGPEYIPNDPHTMSENGKILSNIIKRHALVVANGAKDCVGLITRQRSTTNRTERSCIDLVIFSSDLMKHFKHLLVYESRKHVLTKITKSQKGVVKKESNHIVLLTEFTCKIDATETRNKVEVYNIKNTECQKKFREYTSNTNMLSSIFYCEYIINILAKRFIKKLDGCIKSNFKKIRISKTKKSREEDLFNKLRDLKEKEDDHSIKEKENIAKIAKRCPSKISLVVNWSSCFLLNYVTITTVPTVTITAVPNVTITTGTITTVINSTVTITTVPITTVTITIITITTVTFITVTITTVTITTVTITIVTITTVTNVTITTNTNNTVTITTITNITVTITTVNINTITITITITISQKKYFKIHFTKF